MRKKDAVVSMVPVLTIAGAPVRRFRRPAEFPTSDAVISVAPPCTANQPQIIRGRNDRVRQRRANKESSDGGSPQDAQLNHEPATKFCPPRFGALTRILDGAICNKTSISASWAGEAARDQ